MFLFAFLCRKLDRVSGRSSSDPYPRSLHFMIHLFLSHNYSKGVSTNDVDGMRSFVKEFKTTVWRLFGPKIYQSFSTLNFHLLGLMFDFLDLFGTLLLLSSYGYDHLNLTSPTLIIQNLIRH